MQKTIQVAVKGHGIFELLEGKSIYSVLKENNILKIANCGGNGTCGKCAVRFLKGAPMPKPHERKAFTPDQLREGYRLSCIVKPTTDCEIVCAFSKEEQFVLSDHSFEREYGTKQAKPNATLSALGYKDTYVACDLGTTTIVLQLIEKETGKVIDTFRAMNPQRPFGQDVISRMQKAVQKNALELSECVKNCIKEGLSRWTDAGFHPLIVCISANTVMTHLCLKLDVSSLCVHPFLPQTLEEEETTIHGIRTIFLPGFSAFVGGDLFAGVMVCKNQMKKEAIRTALLIDLGTNGEIVLMHENQLYVTATAAGPAFEGGPTANVPGSDLIFIVAKLLREGILDETGLFCDQYFETGIVIDGVQIRQEDIRSLQVAKAAIFAGIKVLLAKANLDEKEIEKVYLAGGFGYKIDVEAAWKIGLLSKELAKKTVAVGNSSLAGAISYALLRLQLEDREEEEKARACLEEMLWQKKSAICVNLAKEPVFEEYYVNAMSFIEE